MHQAISMNAMVLHPCCISVMSIPLRTDHAQKVRYQTLQSLISSQQFYSLHGCFSRGRIILTLCNKFVQVALSLIVPPHQSDQIAKILT
mmetsp:Transcript_29156/g.53406  ORF Transcript_29156/g.53406 Transcript_29156/m.53406 type:complete len:89 (+) Transcript_29156:420-686(+)